MCGEKEEGQRALLQRLFPDVTVDDTTSFPVWADTFETQAQLTLDNTKKQVQYTCSIAVLVMCNSMQGLHGHIHCTQMCLVSALS